MDELTRLLRALEATDEHELDCEQALAELALYVESLTRERREPFALLERHLEVCRCCREELRALLLALLPEAYPSAG